MSYIRPSLSAPCETCMCSIFKASNTPDKTINPPRKTACRRSLKPAISSLLIFLYSLQIASNLVNALRLIPSPFCNCISRITLSIDFIDPEDETNYYLIKFQEQADLLPTLFDFKDEFVNGNLITLFNEREKDEDINQEEYAPGDVVDIQFYGISKRYYEYIQILINQSESGGPFDTTPVALRGNCANQTNPDEYAYGYFRMTQVSKATYTFE